MIRPAGHNLQPDVEWRVQVCSAALPVEVTTQDAEDVLFVGKAVRVLRAASPGGAPPRKVTGTCPASMLGSPTLSSAAVAVWEQIILTGSPSLKYQRSVQSNVV